MTKEQMAEAAKKLYDEADQINSLTEAQAAVKVISKLVYHLIELIPDEAKS